MEDSLRTVSNDSLACFASLLARAGDSADNIIRDAVYPKLNDDFDRLKVWTGTHGVFRDGPMSLEYRLRNITHIRQHLLRLLNVLKQRLKDLFQIIDGTKVPWDKSDDNELPLGGRETTTEIEQVALDITEVVDRLVRLSITIENSIMREEYTSPDWTAIIIDGPRARRPSVSNYSTISTHITEWSGNWNSRDPYGDADDNTSVTEDVDVLLIGLDFGTLYSGAAWATFAGFVKGEINLITGWPGAGQEDGKVPTQLFYENDQVMWGYQIPPDADPVRLFKLLLVSEEDLSHEQRASETLSRGRKFVRETGKRAVDLAADYLRGLFQHTLQAIRETLGDYAVRALRFEVVITIPSIWKDNSRRSMGHAVQMAGIMDRRPAGETKLTFAPEPEAAALSTLCEAGRNPKEGEVYVLCDAGGGTVDVISYEVTNGKPLEIKEAVEGTGGFCGGSMIDEAFENACKTRLGIQWDRLSRLDVMKIMRQWQNAVKFQFRPAAKEEQYIIEIPSEAFVGCIPDNLTRQPLIKNGRIHFQGSHLKDIFAGAFNEIERLIDGQIHLLMEKGLASTGIILAGGLGSNPYLYEHLKAKYLEFGLSILQSSGMKPRTSICRGAVYRGFLECSDSWSGTIAEAIEVPIKVTATIARSSYGVKYATAFDRMHHRREDRVWDELEGKWMAYNQMRWYLRRGQVVSKKDPERHEFYDLLKRMDDFDGKLNVTLWTCDELEPPERKDFRVDSKSVFQMQVAAKFLELPDFKTASGNMVKKLAYEIEMIPSGASLDIAVYMNGKRLGSQNASVRFE